MFAKGIYAENYDKMLIEAGLNSSYKELWNKWFNLFKDGRKEPDFLADFLKLADRTDNWELVYNEIWKEYGDTLNPDDIANVRGEKRCMLLLLLGRSEMVKGNYEQAYVLMSKARYFYSDAWQWSWLIESATKARKKKDLSSLIDKSLQIFPNNQVLLSQIWEARKILVNSKTYIELFNKDKNPAPNAYYHVMRLLVARRNRNQALLLLNKFIDRYPTSWHAQFWAGYLHYSQKEYGEAVKYMDAVLEQKPGNYGALLYKALSLKSMGFLDKSRETAMLLIKLFPDKYRPYMIAAEILRKLEENEEADEYYQKGLKLKQEKN